MAILRTVHISFKNILVRKEDFGRAKLRFYNSPNFSIERKTFAISITTKNVHRLSVKTICANNDALGA